MTLAHPTVIGPEDPGWDAARLPWNLTMDQRPALVAAPHTTAEVAGAVRHAAERGLRVAAQATGHGARALGPLDDALLLRLGGLDAVTVEASARRLRVGGGVLWGQVTPHTSPHGLAPLAGFASTVGVAGYVLGGGLGWLARRHGLGSTSVVAAEVVVADGTVVRTDADREPDLLWALRGGGGSFGVITELELELHDVGTPYAGLLAWDWTRAGEVLHTWRAWTASVPDELTSVGRIVQVPDLDIAPPLLRGRSLVLVEVCFLGDAAAGAELLAPLRALRPELDTVAPVAPAALTAIHNDPLEPVPGIGDGVLLHDLPAAAIDAFVAVGGPGSGSPLASIEIRQLGGAAARPPADGRAGALTALPEPWAVFGVGMAMAPELGPAIEATLAGARTALAPWTAPRDLANFIETPAGGEPCFDPDAYARLRELRRRYDPDARLLSAHPIA